MMTLDDLPPSQARWLKQMVGLVVNEVIVKKTFDGDVNEARRWLANDDNRYRIAEMISEHAIPVLNEMNRKRRRDLLADLMKVLVNDPQARMNLAHLLGATSYSRRSG